MDTRIYFIPLIMFILAMIGFVVMLVMGRRAKKSVGKAKEAMTTFVREQLPHMTGAGLHTVNTRIEADMYGEGHVQVIAYNKEDIFFIPAMPNPYTQKIKRVKDEAVDTVPVSAVTGVEVNEEKRSVKISVRGMEKTFRFHKTDMFGADHMDDLEQFFSYMKALRQQIGN